MGMSLVTPTRASSDPSAAARPKNVSTGPGAGVAVGGGVLLVGVGDSRGVGINWSVAETSAAVTQPSPFASAPVQLNTSPPSTSETCSPSPSTNSACSCVTSANVTAPSQFASPGMEMGAAEATLTTQPMITATLAAPRSQRRYAARLRTAKDASLCRGQASASTTPPRAKRDVECDLPWLPVAS